MSGMKLFNIDSPFMRALFFIGDLIILNVLFLVSCIPVVTIGASVTAMFTVTMRMTAKDDRGIAKPFFTAFRENFRKATIIWIVFFLIGGILGIGIAVIFHNSSLFSPFMKGLYAIVVFAFLTGLSWVFPLQAKFENDIKSTIKNAFVIGVSHLTKSIVLIVLMLIPVLLAMFFPKVFVFSGFIWLTLGFSGIAVLQSLVIHSVLRKFLT